MKQYCIVGKNRLTREQQIITVPCSLANAVAILKREKSKPPKKREYINLKIAIYQQHKQLELQFKNQ